MQKALARAKTIIFLVEGLLPLAKDFINKLETRKVGPKNVS